MRQELFISTLQDVPAEGSISFLAKTDGARVIFKGSHIASTGGPLYVSLYKDPVITSVGTPYAGVIFNQHLLSEYQPTISITTNPTTTSLGDLVLSDISSGTQQQANKAILERNLHLKQDSYYLYIVENASPQIEKVAVDFLWEEYPVYLLTEQI